MSPQARNQSQLERFRESAREIGADESDDALDRIMGKLDLKKKPDGHDAGEKAPKGKSE